MFIKMIPMYANINEMKWGKMVRINIIKNISFNVPEITYFKFSIILCKKQNVKWEEYEEGKKQKKNLNM